MRAQRSTPHSALGLILLALLALLIAAPVSLVRANNPVWLDSPVPGGAVCQQSAPYGGSNPAGKQTFHNAVDYCKARGADVVAVASGKVVWNDYWPSISQTNHAVGHGITVVIYHPDAGVYTYSAHLDQALVKVGDYVKQGDVVGLMGSTGYANGLPHLHFGVGMNPPSIDNCFNESCWDNPADYLGKAHDSGTPTETIGPVTIEVPQLENVTNAFGNAVAWLWRSSTWLVIVLAIVFGVLGWMHGLSTRRVLAIIGVVFLVIAWVLPNVDQWLPNPLGLSSTTITTHYGDVRVDANGTTAASWDVTDGTTIVAVSPGVVIPTPNPMFAFGTEQVWVEVGNHLWLQYRFPQGSQIEVSPGTHVSVGDTLGTTSAGQISLGVSSKDPNEFVSIDDRTYGWMDPESYLGQTVLSGARKAEATFLQLGLILLILAWFWPSKTVKDNLPSPWDWKTARFMNVQLVLGLVIYSLGITLQGGFYKWVGGIPTVFSLIYFVGRLRYRRYPRRVPLVTYLGSILGLVAEFSLVLNLGIAGLANPQLLSIGQAVALNLPTLTTPRLTTGDNGWLQQYLESGGTTYNLSDTHAVTPFSFTYWNGGNYRVDIPQEVWDASIEADKKHGCDARLIIAIAWTESPNFTNHTSENYAGAMGTWQFIPGTWNTYWPDPATRPSRTDVYASADAACRKAVNQGLPQTDGDRALYIDRFAHRPLKESVWNMHDGQAGTAYDLWQELKRRSSGTPTPIPTTPKLADWQQIESGNGVGLYQQGSNFLALADLSKGAQVVLTGGDSCSSIEGHWNELGSKAFFIANATYFEASCQTTFPFVKNGAEVSAGAKTANYPSARYLAISGNTAAVVPYSEWMAGNRAPYMTAGLPPSAETARNAYTLVGVSADGKMVFILQVTSATPQEAVAMLQALGVPENNIILLDGGGSTQGKFANGYTRNSGRAIPQGIGIIAP